jgi:phage/plasmid-associated DNA primase
MDASEYVASYVGFRFAEAEVATKFRDEEGNRFIRTEALGWLKWDGKRWAEVDDQVIVREITYWIINHYRNAAAMAARAAEQGDKSLGQSLFDISEHWFKYQSAAKITSVGRLAKGMLVRDQSEFDTDPDILNVRNGVIDLPTGKLMPHDPSRMITRLTNTNYRPGAKHRDWVPAPGENVFYSIGGDRVSGIRQSLCDGA